MSTITQLPLRMLVAIQCVATRATAPVRRNELGQAAAEYGVVLLVAVALGLAVLSLFTGGGMNGLLQGLLGKVLDVATGMIK